MKRIFLFLFILGFCQISFSQDEFSLHNIHGVKLYVQGNQLSYPIIGLNSNDLLELHFDDLDGYVKNYSYTFELRNADWSPVNLSTFDYLKGFSQVRLNQYRASSVALTKYIHYQAVLPDRNCVPTKSGNYLLKVFLDGDQNKLALTRKVLVVDKQVEIGAQILQPFNSQLNRTHQKVQFVLYNKKLINFQNPAQQLKVVLMQNFRWDNAKRNLVPTFIRNNSIEFNTESDAVFPAGKEYRWVDLRSFRFQSDRILKAEIDKSGTDIIMQPDGERGQLRYLRFTDYNGFFYIESSDASNPWWQGDYANVHFTFVPNNNQPYPDKKVFIAGELTQYDFSDDAAMAYNAEKGVYEKTLFLKQGYYTYTYVTKDANNKKAEALTEQTDGNYWETENDYTVLVYYRSLSGRHDELIGLTTVNSLNSRQLGF